MRTPVRRTHGGGDGGTPSGAKSSDFVQSLDRGLAVIRAFDAEHPRLTLSEVSRTTGLTRAAARRFLLTLVELGYVRSDGRDFSLRPRVLELGYAYLSGMSLTEVAQPHMEELVGRVHESSSIAVLDGHDVVYIVRVPTKRIMAVAIAVGTRFPAYVSAMGRVLLAGRPGPELDRYMTEVDLRPLTDRTVVDRDRLRAVIEEVGRQGFAVVDQELEDGIRAVAVPIRDGTGASVAAINIAVHASRVSLETLREVFLPLLLATAEDIERDVRAQGPRGPSVARTLR